AGDEGASRCRGRRRAPRHHRRSPRYRGRLQAGPERGGEDPLRPVPLAVAPTRMTPDTGDRAGITTTQLRVRYKDPDWLEGVYYGNYLTYFEVGRVEYLRQHGLAMSEVDRRIHM